MRKELYFSLGYIGHKAEKLQKMYKNYTEEPNENGYFLKFSNYTYVSPNKGVMVHTNCFESEEHFNDDLFSKLLLDL